MRLRVYITITRPTKLCRRKADELRYLREEDAKLKRLVADRRGGWFLFPFVEEDKHLKHVFLRRPAVRDDRLKSTAVCGRDVHDNACSHIESLNCFGRFGNRLNGSDH